MTVGALRLPAALALPAGAGGLAAFVLGSQPSAVAVLLLLACAGGVALVLWPWAALPAAVLGSAVASQALGLSRVGPIVAVHVVLLAAGFLAAALRRALDPAWGARVAAPADLPMLVLAAGVVLGAAFGLARGHEAHDVVVAAYEIGVVPAYYFLATHTLTTPARLRGAGVLFVVGAAALVVAGLGDGGRHGGLFAALALAPILAASAAASRGRRGLLLALAGLFALDVALSAYRALWLAAGVALVVQLVTGASRLRRTAVAGIAVAALAAGVLALANADGFASRVEAVTAAVGEPSGYRLPEAAVGWEAFRADPVLGDGLGQAEPDRFLPGFGVTDVGPVYHVFYVMLLANAGVVGLALLVWPLATALRRARGERSGQAAAFRALLVGFLAAAAFAAPTAGHWELGLLAAVALLAARFERPEARS
jgi:hypothetical protein